MTEQEILDFVHDQQFYQRDELEWKIRESAVRCASDPRVTSTGIHLAWMGPVNWQDVYSDKKWPDISVNNIYVRVPRVAAVNWRSMVLLCEEIIRRQIKHHA